MLDKNVRVRYAPSPTGFFHVGGARTALFNYLYAKHLKGTFILRIEDTDIERNVQGGIESQIQNLKWMGIKIDESIENPGQYGPYIQTHKLERYKKLAYDLVAQGKAYFCFCSKQELDQAREEATKKGLTPKYNRHCLNLSKQEIQQKLDSGIEHTIRLKIQDNTTISWNDLIRGKIEVPTSALTDPVILKSNGIPMYNFAVVVDDYDMQISHVLRGEEHISNTPYQIAIKEALGFNDRPIKYGHLSVIVNKDGKKLSKRDLTLKQFIQDYKEMGFWPHAITNFLSLLGWCPKDNKEIMSMEEMIEKFDIHHVSKNPTFFDFEKMKWVGNKYIAGLDDVNYLNFVKPFVKVDLTKFTNHESNILLLFKKQLHYASELNDLINENFFNYNPQNVSNKFNFASSAWIDTFNAFKQEISKLNEQLTFDNAKTLINQTKSIAKTNGMDLFMPIRIVITGIEHGPELNKIMTILGKQEIITRLENFTKILNDRK